MKHSPDGKLLPLPFPIVPQKWLTSILRILGYSGYFDVTQEKHRKVLLHNKPWKVMWQNAETNFKVTDAASEHKHLGDLKVIEGGKFQNLPQ